VGENNQGYYDSAVNQYSEAGIEELQVAKVCFHNRPYNPE